MCNIIPREARPAARTQKGQRCQGKWPPGAAGETTPPPRERDRDRDIVFFFAFSGLHNGRADSFLPRGRPREPSRDGSVSKWLARGRGGGGGQRSRARPRPCAAPRGRERRKKTQRDSFGLRRVGACEGGGEIKRRGARFGRWRGGGPTCFRGRTEGTGVMVVGSTKKKARGAVGGKQGKKKTGERTARLFFSLFFASSPARAPSRRPASLQEGTRCQEEEEREGGCVRAPPRSGSGFVCVCRKKSGGEEAPGRRPPRRCALSARCRCCRWRRRRRCPAAARPPPRS